MLSGPLLIGSCLLFQNHMFGLCSGTVAMLSHRERPRLEATKVISFNLLVNFRNLFFSYDDIVMMTNVLYHVSNSIILIHYI